MRRAGMPRASASSSRGAQRNQVWRCGVAVVREKAVGKRLLNGQRIAGPLLVTPMAFWMLAFFLVPLFLILVYSFGYMGVYDSYVHLSWSTDARNGVYSVFSLHAYRQILSGIYVKAFSRTAMMVFGNTVACLVLGYPLAYWISRKTGRRKTIFILLLMLPFWTSFLIRTYAWTTILNNPSGLLNSALMKLHVISQPLHIMYTMKAVAIGLIYDYLPFMVLPLFVSIEKIDGALLEASKDLGAGKWTTFRRVTLPLSLPGIFAGCMLVAIPTTGEFVIPSILGGDKVVLWGWLIYKAFTSYSDWALGSALSNVLMLVMVIIIAAYVKRVGTEEF
jgi:ABC-type spermidine/putrescine transport system permease subunit I